MLVITKSWSSSLAKTLTHTSHSPFFLQLQHLSMDADFLNGKNFLQILENQGPRIYCNRRLEERVNIYWAHLLCPRYYVLPLSNLIYKSTGKVDTIIHIFRCHICSSERLGKLPKMTQLVNDRADFFNVFIYFLGQSLEPTFWLQSLFSL